MAIAHAMWTHGHSLQVENPQVGNVERKGFSANYVMSTMGGNWIHFAIPTPVIVDGKRLKVDSVIVRIRGNAKVNSIHVYDGENKIGGQDNLNLQPTQWLFERISVPAHPEIQWGLGISVHISTGPDGGHMEFAAAGCDFI